jgi:FkbM family methyltransferase
MSRLNLCFQILYGTQDTYIDVTEICLTRQELIKNNIITIPEDDFLRSTYFSDPIVGALKYIFIKKLDTHECYKYDDTVDIIIDMSKNTTEGVIHITTKKCPNKKLEKIHKTLKLYYGTFQEELPLQKLVLKYLTGNENVVELGGNIGRVSLVIASILGNANNQHNFVSIESNPSIASQLIHNRNMNSFYFHVECAALSKRNLIQQGMETKVSDDLLDGYIKVNSITFEDLQSKYNIQFDTLVVDCEGAFYYIILDFPDFLDNIKLIIMKNNYVSLPKKLYINDILKINGFYVEYVESGGWGPCYDNFYEVWKK